MYLTDFDHDFYKRMQEGVNQLEFIDPKDLEAWIDGTLGKTPQLNPLNGISQGAFYYRIIDDSHYWTDIPMLIHYLELIDEKKLNKKYLITGLINTLKNGYAIQKTPIDIPEKPKPVTKDELIDYIVKNLPNF